MLNLLQGLTNLTVALSAKIKVGQLLDEAQAHTDAKEYKAAVKCLGEAVELGSFDAMARLATSYMKGQGVAPDWKKAADLLQQVPQDQKIAVFGTLGMLYGIGGYGLKRNLEKSRDYLNRAVLEESDMKAQEMLVMLEKRQGIFGMKEMAKPQIPWRDGSN